MAIENAFGKSVFVFFFSKTIFKNGTKLETKKSNFQNFKINFAFIDLFNYSLFFKNETKLSNAFFYFRFLFFKNENSY